ncbi:MAG: hypothetical protein J0M12_08610 [Deltaproteobacteria bacterium]|nr:hypothetical protein [Deltaproteobacteria bacterium]
MRTHRKIFLVAPLVVGVGLLYWVRNAAAEFPPSQCSEGFPVVQTASDDMFDRIIKFFYTIIQAMISLFCRIIHFAGFRCG